MMGPLISVIVPVYNVQDYLPRCLDSILSQTYSNLEIILVDDGSTDSCGKICDTYAAKDSRIKVIHKKNGGLGFARNSGFDVCSGEYVMFVDSDDYLSEDAVQVLYQRIALDGSNMAVGKHADTYESGGLNDRFCRWMKDAMLSGEEVLTKLGEENYIAVVAWAKLYKRSLFDGLRYPSMKCAEDLWIHPMLVDRCEKISIVDRTVYFYFQRSDSIMHQKTEQAKLDDTRAVLHLVAFLRERGFEKGASRWYGIGIDKALALNCKRDGLALFKECFDFEERKVLLGSQRIRKKMKWLFLYVPVLYTVVKGVKHLLGRK